MTGPEPPTIVVTGATDGLGRALARRLASDGLRLILHGRYEGRVATVADDIAATHGVERPRTVVANLDDLAQVARLGAELRDMHVDVLVNNAGIGPGVPYGRERRTSADGYELRFAVNYLSGFLLTELLADHLRACAQPGVPSRVVHVASLGQQNLDFDDLMLEHGYSGTRAYAQSKLAQIMGGFEMAGRVPAAELTVASLHPGTYMPTKIVLGERPSSVDSLETGVESVTRAALDPELDTVTGEFFDRMQPARAKAQAYDADARATLRARSLELVAAHLP
jgi:NAD(P)-dependent dehydrogenase (short-subunit alcohol dehydrogenase family)